MTPQELGYWFEDKVRDCLKELQETYPCMFHRFVDSKAARNTVAAQPGDHMLLLNGKAVLIEEKASMRHASMRSNLATVKDGQVAFHRKWHRSGNPSVVLFYSKKEGRVEIWDGKMIVDHRLSGKRIRVSDKPIETCTLPLLRDTLPAVCRGIK